MAEPAVTAVIFDWGGTLTEPLNFDELTDMWRLAARRLAPENEDEMCARLEAVDAASWERISVDQQACSLSQILATASAELGVDVAQVVMEEAATHYLDQWTPHIVHDPEAVPTLAALRNEGLRIGLLSNTHWPRAFHEHFVARDGLADLIDVECYTSEMERTKPHPTAFRTVLRELDVAASASVFVGDRLYDDVFGAKALGMRTVHRRDRGVPGFDVEPDAVIDRLPELIPLLDKWMNER
jgi:putative hydrolase of the HAD superfamily